MQYNGEMKKILTKWGLTGYNNEERQLFSLDDMTQFLPSLLQGALLTITVSLIAFALAMVCGLATGLARMSRIWPLRVVAAIYIQFIRGTPLLLQLFFIYYVLPYAGIVLTPFVSGVLGVTVNYTAYMAEVFRSGIQAIPKGQWEAGASVGMLRRLMLRRIILPQAIRIIVPSIGNFFVSIFKDSALVSVITMRDLMFSGQLLASATYKHFEIFTMVAVIYVLISYPSAKLVEWIEMRLDITRRPMVLGMRT
jgi:polar amino acid transport system permease protein